ncbi:MAG: hypothetical protein LBT52_01895, partial [Clostridiales Family XIII bacterium]|nr:hypothetical protein [Clostridiales Family XIII bacterium]
MEMKAKRNSVIAFVVAAVFVISCIFPDASYAKSQNTYMTIHALALMHTETKTVIKNGKEVKIKVPTGSGDSVLIETGKINATGARVNKQFLLMDSGESAGGEDLKRYLEAIVGTPKENTANKKKEAELDLYFSHMHGDHTGKYKWILKNYTVNKVYLPQHKYKTSRTEDQKEIDKANDLKTTISAIAKANGAKVIHLNYKREKKSTSSFKMGDVQIDVIGSVYGKDEKTKKDRKNDTKHPYNKTYHNSLINLWSLVTMVTFNGGMKFLSAGDIQNASEYNLRAEYKGTGKLNADIMKLSHHGVKHRYEGKKKSNSNLKTFMKKVSPTYSFVMIRNSLGVMKKTAAEAGNMDFGVQYAYTARKIASEYGFSFSVAHEQKNLLFDISYRNGEKKIELITSPNNDPTKRTLLNGTMVKLRGSTGYGKNVITAKETVVVGDNALPVFDKYYITKSGIAVTGTAIIKGTPYLFGSGGKMINNGYKKVKGKVIYKKLAYVEEDKKWYSFKFDGEMRVGWQPINGKDYYFDEKYGYALKGRKKVSNISNINKKSYYHFTKKGRMEKEVLRQWGKYKYYYKTDGTQLTSGSITIKGKKYWFNSKGRLLKNKNGAVDTFN